MIKIRQASPSDLTQIVGAHEHCFPGFLMTMLGSAFLRVYYKMALSFPGTVALIAQEEGNTLGFIVGYLDPSQFYALLRRRWWLLAWTATKGMLRAPSLLARVSGNFRRVRRSAKPRAGQELGVELASVGVLPAASGKGLGKALIAAFTHRARTCGGDQIYLTTDAENNDKVNTLYVSLMFTLAETFIAPGGRLMNKYVLMLHGQSGANQNASSDNIAKLPMSITA
jgi:ribosomal protein S18 acetylase RimI-like enzyme